MLSGALGQELVKSMGDAEGERELMGEGGRGSQFPMSLDLLGTEPQRFLRGLGALTSEQKQKRFCARPLRKNGEKSEEFKRAGDSP